MRSEDLETLLNPAPRLPHSSPGGESRSGDANPQVAGSNPAGRADERVGWNLPSIAPI